VNVLIVDDKQENCYLLEALFRGMGTIVFTAANGAEALQVLAEEQVDLVISDILMPVMDGFQLCRKIRKDPDLAAIPIIIYTATYTGPKDEEFALKIGANRFVIKPCEPQEFLRIVEEVMQQNKATQQISEEQLPEEVILKLYNERFVRKLEKKMEQYEQELQERQIAEEKLKSQYELLQIAGETARFGGWSVDLKNDIVAWSDAVADIHEMPHGYAPTVSDGISFYAPEWQEKITHVFSACAQEGIPYDEEMMIITKSGKLVWVRTIGRAVKDEKGNIIRVEGSFQDISEKKKAEEKLRDNEVKFKTIFNQSYEGIYIHDLDGNILDVNEMACNQSGYSKEELLNLKISSLHPKVSNINMTENNIHELWKQWQPGQISKLEVEHQRKDGSIYDAEIITGVIMLGKKKFIMAIVKDITDRKMTEMNLRNLKDDLEIQVAEKTRELQERLSELQRYHDATVNRKFRIRELKDEIEKLKGKS
jgi:PAS domain S-box-containing protein